ncbi:MAG: YiiG family protein [Lachnospiraceae bacterium]|jgi:hypothetical protein|nr:YiiG family protein [Lachnospiraceae bacterium]
MRKEILAKAAALLLTLAFVLAGCGNKAKEEWQTLKQDRTDGKENAAQQEDADTAEDDMASGKENTAAGEEDIPPEQMDLIKYNYYVELNNQLIEILNSIDYYYQVVEDAEEFSLLPDTGLTYGYRVYGNNTDTLEDCLLLADMEPSYGDVDALVKEMAQPLGALMQTFLDISSSNDYADNQYQKAKEYHAVIRENTDVVVELGYSFMDAIDEMGDAKTAEEEEKMKAEGNLIIYNASRSISIGKQILDEVYEQGVNDSNLTDLDLTEIQILHDELVEVVADFDAATADNDQLIKESLSNSRPFDGLYDGLIDALEWMMKQVESGTLPDMSGSGAPLGSLAHFSEVLGQCVDRYNSVFVE